MSFETDLVTLLRTVTAKVHADVTPDTPVFPCIIYQQVGGQSYAYLEKKLPNHKHGRLQITVWDVNRADADVKARAIEKALIESAFTVEAYGAFVALYEQSIKKYGTRQDFGIWYPDP